MQENSTTLSSQTDRWICPDWRARAVSTLLLSGTILVLFRDLLASFLSRWSNEPQYSHGFAIPLIAVGLAWFLRDRIAAGRAAADTRGIALLAVGCALHVMGVYLFVEAIDCLGLLLCITGSILLIWGRNMTMGIWPALLFLVFMFPLPFRIERMLSAPLQLYGAEQAAWYIQLFGIPAVAKGSLILMSEHKLGVAEACSGMRMLTVFFAISAAAIIVTRRNIWEKIVILVSAVPIALICNIGRIVATALAYHYLGEQTADLVFHDLSGWLMMPAAMLLLLLVLKVLDWLFIPGPDVDMPTGPTISPTVVPGIQTVSRP